MKRRVLFLCTGNSCRSQMAEAIVNDRLGEEWDAVSAGTQPAGYVHPRAVSVLAEIGIDWQGHVSKHADQFRDTPFDLVVTVCEDAAENCPVWLGPGHRVHLGFRDPARAIGNDDQVMAVFRTVRDAISEEMPVLLNEWTRVHSERDCANSRSRFQMPELLETIVDKFIFKVATDRLYTNDHLWVKLEGGLARIGLSDYLQQISGDVAFVDVEPAGSALAAGDDLASVETIKVNLVLPTPIGGVVKETNALLEDAPEFVNQDPYGDGWLALVEATNLQADQANLLDHQTYYGKMKAEAEEEARKP